MQFLNKAQHNSFGLIRRSDDNDAGMLIGRISEDVCKAGIQGDQNSELLFAYVGNLIVRFSVKMLIKN